MHYRIENLSDLNIGSRCPPGASPPPPCFGDLLVCGPEPSAEEDLRRLVKAARPPDRRDEAFEFLYGSRCYVDEIVVDPLVHPTYRELGVLPEREPPAALLGFGMALALAMAASFAVASALLI